MISRWHILLFLLISLPAFAQPKLIDAQGMIRNDYGYSPLTKGIFEGRELFTEIDRMVGKAK